MAVTRYLGTAALVAPPVVWLAAQQAMGEIAYVACRASGPPVGTGVAALGLVICAAAMIYGWKIRAAQRVLAPFAMGSGALFGLGCIALIAASLMTPPCAR